MMTQSMVKIRLEIKRLTLPLMSILLFACLAASVRPVQDDYVSLRDMATIGLKGSILNMWQQWGGNLSVIAISNSFLGLHLKHFYFFGLALHSVITGLLVLSTFRILHYRLIGDLKSYKALGLTSWLVFSVLGMASFISPGFVGILNFTSASTAHLWSVLLTIHGLNYCLSKDRILISFIPSLGFLSANLNITEGLFGFSLTISTLIFLKFSQSVKSRMIFTKLCLFALGQFLGLLVIVSAPGFTNRSSVVGTPNSISEFFIRFMHVLPINLGDLFQHPSWLLGILLGCYIKPILNAHDSMKLIRGLIPLAISSVILFIIICIADSFAYPSWYHTLSVYIFVFPLFFVIGVCLDSRIFKLNFTLKLVKTCLILVVCFSTFLFGRDMFMLENRSQAWDEAAVYNICQIEKGGSKSLKGPEITYWPLHLGIEDVGTWDWIQSAYTDWVRADSTVQSWCAN